MEGAIQAALQQSTVMRRAHALSQVGQAVAVEDIPQALRLARLIRDGQRIRVHGTDGYVEILPQLADRADTPPGY